MKNGERKKQNKLKELSQYGQKLTMATFLVFLIVGNGISIKISQSQASDSKTVVNSVTTPPLKLNIDIYYESLCPPSLDFIISSLSKMVASPKYNEMANINLIPFGNADLQKDGFTHYTATCQHGNEECRGNKYQACAIKLVEQDLAMNFITCVSIQVMNGRILMDTVSGSKNFDEAAQKWNFLFKQMDSKVDSNNIKECVDSEDNTFMLKILNDKTKSANIKYTPYVTLNGKFYPWYDKMIRENLYEFIWTAYRGVKPTAWRPYDIKNDMKESVYDDDAMSTQQNFLSKASNISKNSTQRPNSENQEKIGVLKNDIFQNQRDLIRRKQEFLGIGGAGQQGCKKTNLKDAVERIFAGKMLAAKGCVRGSHEPGW